MDNIIKDTAGKIETIIAQAVQEGQKATEAYWTEMLDALREEVNLIRASMGEETPIDDKSFIVKYQEHVMGFEKKALSSLKESKEYGSSFKDISEAAYMYAGGFAGISSEQDRFFQLAAREKVKYSPHIRNIANTVQYAIAPSTVKIDIPNDQVDTIIEEELKKNKFQKRLKGWIRNCFVDGELFPLIFVRSDGTVKIRQVDPQEVVDIETHPEDKETILSYKREVTDLSSSETKTYYYPDYEYEEQKEDEIDGKESENASQFPDGVYCMHFHYGFRDYERCEIPLMPVLRYDRIYTDLLMDLARLYHERSRVVWILKVRSGKQNGVDRTTLPFRDSVIKIETDDKTWRIEDPKLGDFNSREYGHPHRLAVSAGVSFPEYLVYSDSSNQSYASLRKSDSPFALVIQSTQSMWEGNLKEFIGFIIKKKVEKNQLPEYTEIERPPIEEVFNLMAALDSKDSAKISECLEGIKVNEAAKEKKRVKTVDLPVTVIFPKNIGDNPLLFAQAVSILVQAGIMSKRTARKWIGIDPDIEAMLVKYDTPVDVQTGKTEQTETNTEKKITRDTYAS